jgi:hypothetical protein
MPDVKFTFEGDGGGTYVPVDGFALTHWILDIITDREIGELSGASSYFSCHIIVRPQLHLKAYSADGDVTELTVPEKRTEYYTVLERGYKYRQVLDDWWASVPKAPDIDLIEDLREFLRKQVQRGKI